MRYMAYRGDIECYWTGKMWVKDKNHAKRFTTIEKLITEMQGLMVEVLPCT
jgi:hypothetical protein